MQFAAAFLLWLAFWACFGPQATAQTTPDAFSLEGLVLDAQTKQALPNALVFVGQSTKTTQTNLGGGFSFEGLPLGTLEVVASASGYLPKRIKVRATQSGLLRDTIRLQAAPRQSLATQLKSKEETQRFNRLLRHFIARLVGTSDNAYYCILGNPWVLNLQADQSGKQLANATATALLSIENMALGYRLLCYVERFDIVEKAARLDGCVGFEPLVPVNDAQKNTWAKKRATAYYGSLMHFLRSLATGDTEKNGFELYERSDYERFYISETPKHSIPTTHAAVALATDVPFEKKLFFPKLLQINYLNEAESNEYRKFAYQMNKSMVATRRIQASWLQMRKPEAAVFNIGGWLCDPTALDLYGFMEFEVLADRLPTDYRP